jgi:aminoglycoside/choline kinase family phosphotransferase
VHKDFELSNLIHLQNREGHLKCGILDFQNAFIGFSGWDIFSLLENPRIYFDDKYNDELIEYFYNNTNQNISFNEFLIQYYFLNTARQSRVIGRWINLDKKNKNNYYSKYLGVTIKRLKKSLYYLQNSKLSKLYSKVIGE